MVVIHKYSDCETLKKLRVFKIELVRWVRVLQTREYSYNGHTMQVIFRCAIVIVAILYLKIFVKVDHGFHDSKSVSNPFFD